MFNGNSGGCVDNAGGKEASRVAGRPREAAAVVQVSGRGGWNGSLW